MGVQFKKSSAEAFRAHRFLKSLDKLSYPRYVLLEIFDQPTAIPQRVGLMSQTIARWILTVGLMGIGQMSPPLADARELDQQTFGMLGLGMTEAAVVARTGPPDRRLDNIQPTLLGQVLMSYQYVLGWRYEHGRMDDDHNILGPNKYRDTPQSRTQIMRSSDRGTTKHFY
jgi:hypothetical protein